MSLREMAERIDRVGADVGTAAAQLAELSPPPAAFGAGAPGLPGAAGRALHALAAAAFAARSREAVAQGARYADLARHLRQASVGYAEADDRARHAARRGRG